MFSREKGGDGESLLMAMFVGEGWLMMSFGHGWWGGTVIAIVLAM
ncbi:MULTISPECIES: hypothetical protein [unclassified Bartonella]